MKEILIRAGRGDDLDRVIALERTIKEAPHWTETEYAAAMGGEDSVRRCLFVAESEGALLGFSVGKLVGDLGELESVAVDARARRCGVGRELCRAVMRWCQQQGAVVLELEVRAKSEGAAGLYRGLGFVVAGHRPRYYSGPPDDAVLMRLDLKAVQK